MKCQNCGSELFVGATHCHACGSTTMNQNPQQNFSQQMNPGFQQVNGFNNVSQKDAAVWLKILCFLFPLVGFIMYFVKKNEAPVYAKSCLIWGAAGFAVNLVFIFK